MDILKRLPEARMHGDGLRERGATSDGEAGWAALRRAVRASALNLGLLHLPTRRFIELSSPAAALLGLQQADLASTDVVTLTEDPEGTRRALALVSQGTLDGYQAQRKLRRGDKVSFDAYISVRVLARDGANDRGIALLDGSELAPDEQRAEREGEAVLVVGIVDASQRIERISTDIESIPGQLPADVTLHPVLDLLHPEDVAHALGAFDAAREPGTQTSVVVRARDDTGSWSPARLAVARFGDGTGRYGFALGPADTGAPALTSDRVGELEYRLRRIAREVEAADVIDGFENLPNLNQVPGLRDLTSRQWEIITRLLRGERVPTIARRMYLSQSTIRNHLASVFRKVGVHSQPELLELLRAGKDQ